MQNATIDGDRNILVQAAGNGIDIRIGPEGNRLELARRHLRNVKVRKELDLLNPFTRAIDLVGRDGFLADLEAWLQGPAPIAVRCLTGRGGSGKTRLALELCARAETGIGGQAWHAGFATSTERPFLHLSGLANPADWVWPPNTLIVVDYAAAKAALLRSLLVSVVNRADEPDRKLRILLLERHADREVGWWPELGRSRGWSEEGLIELFDPEGPIALPNLARGEEQWQVLAAVMAAASKLAGWDPPLQPPPWGSDPDFDRRLADPGLTFEPLHLAMAGLNAVHAGTHRLLTLSRTDLADKIAAYELDRIAGLARASGLGPELLQHMAALVTLTAGASLDGIEGVIEEENTALGLVQAGEPLRLAVALRDAMPAEIDGALGPVLPDIVGEALILKALARTPLGIRPNHQTAVVARASVRSGHAVLSTVIRIAQDYADSDSHASLGWLKSLIDLAEGDELLRIAGELPESSIRLRLVAAEVQARVTDHLRADHAAGNDDASLMLPGALNNLANRLSDLGRREAALAAAEEAVDLYRELAAARPDAVRPDLARSLLTLANRLSEVGRRDAALAAAEEAVDLYRELAAARPDAVRPDLARSLHTLAISLSEVGRREAALAAAEEAVNLYRELAAARPEAFRPDLALSLNNLAVMLSDLGRREAALAAAEEAVDLYRELAAARPDAVRPDLARSLHTLAISLSDLGRREAALAAAEEAGDLYRELAAARPEAFRPDLARSLDNLANRLSGMGRRDAALVAAEEAVDLYRELAAARPEAFRPDLALSLNNLAVMLSDLGRREAALAAAEEAGDLYRELAAARPDAFRPNLAGSLTNLANRLSALGRREAALAAAEEARDLYRELAAARPDAFRPNLAGSLTNLATMLSDLGRREAALAAAEEAADLYRELAAARPDAFRPNLAVSLTNLANRLSALGRREAALAAAEETVAIHRELAAARPDAFEVGLARSLLVLGHCLEASGRTPEAVALDREAVVTIAPSFLAHPAAFADLTKAIIVDSLRRIDAIGEQPEIETLEPLIETLERLNRDGKGTGDDR